MTLSEWQAVALADTTKTKLMDALKAAYGSFTIRGCTKSKLKRQRDDGTNGNNETDGNSTDQGLKLSVPSVISVCSVISLPALSLLHSMSLPLQGEGHFNFDFVHPPSGSALRQSAAML